MIRRSTRLLESTLSCLFLGVVFSGSVLAQSGPSPSKSPFASGASDPPVATFSIVACDLERREWGVAVQSKILAVGSLVPFAQAGAGAVATQSFANTTFGPRGLKLLAAGSSAEDTVKQLIAADAGRRHRQLAVIDAQGNVAHFTGDNCLDWAGAVSGRHYSCQGNILVGRGVVEAMAKAFETKTGKLADRLTAALEAAQKAGGDKRGRQSAALLVVKKNAGYGGFNDRMIDLRVDDHKTPVVELKRLLDLRFGRK
ncbi:MAG: DUF1028 domain-containing protein [Planctomycetales bacterium]